MGLFSKDPDSDGDSDGEKTSFLEERGFVASAIVIGAVLICLVVWAVASNGSDTPAANPSQTPSTIAPTEQPTESTGPPATPTEQPTATQTAPPPPNSHTGGCHDSNPEQAIPRLAAPVAVTWQFEGEMLVPIQAAAGPASTGTNGVRSCFAHSPTGAVFAAMVLLGQVQNPQVSVAALKTRVLAGPGRTAAIAAARNELQTPPTEAGDVQFSGFKVLYYTTTQAIVQVVANLNNKAYGALPITMQWSHGDWYAVLQDDGTFNGSVEPDILSSLNGYVRFSGAS
ncbi:hypothetical protein ACFWUU_27475 [Kribbella sp. NPDC058693]|uniref:DUF8175 domain-containing protein n=1 Tax=Kribbella jiaozuonensis TaxID=2575441 RepID=A0A4U3LRM8_9ACTN|nr:hypothetical protein [Kribbella jiaozuonensis]TKK77824.1 hypothetical protein FDA38_22110 [Kribbella jiaozuonensis]